MNISTKLQNFVKAIIVMAVSLLWLGGPLAAIATADPAVLQQAENAQNQQPSSSTTFCNSGQDGAGCVTGLPHAGAGQSELKTILQILFGILAALAVLFIVIGALRYVVSDGDPQDASKARNTIVYALVGLLLAIAAEAIVSFALNSLLNSA